MAEQPLLRPNLKTPAAAWLDEPAALPITERVRSYLVRFRGVLHMHGLARNCVVLRTLDGETLAKATVPQEVEQRSPRIKGAGHREAGISARRAAMAYHSGIQRCFDPYGCKPFAGSRAEHLDRQHLERLVHWRQLAERHGAGTRCERLSRHDRSKSNRGERAGGSSSRRCRW